MCVEFPSLIFLPDLLRIDQASPTLDLVNDYFRFVIGFFEIITISAPHIYRSALPLSPRDSIVRKVYKPYLQRLPRVVHGLPISWESAVTTVRHSDPIKEAAWSSCSRFVVVSLPGTIEILDAATLKRLQTFAHPQTEIIQWFSFSPDSHSLTWFGQEHGLTTWDLQTGGRISVIPPTPETSSSQYFSSAYSVDGRIIAVACGRRDRIIISTYNLLSGTHIYSHHVSEGQFIAPIWTHGDFLRFVTVKGGSITIWEIGFTSEHALVEIESLPAPDNIINPRESLFLPTRSRLAFTLTLTLKEAVLVWDARDSKFLLNFAGGNWPRGLSFSSDGGFFAYRAYDQGIHLWKESPTGYALHRKLASDIGMGSSAKPLLSPNGESIIASDYLATRLWRTTDPITPIIPTQSVNPVDFILEFSPDRLLAVAARLGHSTVTIIDLKSGDPRLIIDTDMEIGGLGVNANTVIAVGDEKVVTWSLPAGDRVLNAKANIRDSVRTIAFDSAPPPDWPLFASTSPNFNYVATTRGPNFQNLNIYDMSTGKHLVGTTSGNSSRPWFTRDGCEVWSSRYEVWSPRHMSMEGWKIVKDEKSDVVGLEPLGPNAKPSGGYLWESSHGHDVTDDGWILDSKKKRVMWLPYRWRIYERYRIWNGQFLGLLDPKLPEPVILELDE